MKDNLVECIEMANGLNLEIFDKSRDIADDTCLVCIIFKIDINIEKKIFNNKPDDSDYNSIKAKLGDSIQYEVKHERNFIKKDLRKTVFKEVKESFLKTNLKYLSHEKFAEKYVLKKYVNKKRY